MRSEGSKFARVAVVVGSPTRFDIQEDKPLQGPSGREFNSILQKIKVPRSEFYITCAVPENLSCLKASEKQIERAIPTLLKELNSLPNLNVILTMGETALQAVSNFKYKGVGSLRGSILESPLGKKLIPTWDFKHIMEGNWHLKSVVKFDILRALEHKLLPKIERPTRDYYIEPTYFEALAYLDSLMGAEAIAFDIENPGGYIHCIGFAPNKEKAYCIPIMHKRGKPYWTLDQEVEIWRRIQKVLEQKDTTYITQNGLYDCWHLWKHGILTPYMDRGFDTMYAHRVLYPDLPHALAFLTSIYTEEPYYKAESGKHVEGGVPDRQYWTYNCKDCVVTFEVALTLMQELQDEGCLDYYKNIVQRMWTTLTEMHRIGIRVDREILDRERARIERETLELQVLLGRELGFVPNTKSPKDMERVFKEIGVAPTRTKKGNPKRDETALLIAANRKESARSPLLKIIEINRRRTIMSSFLQLKTDENNFYHPSYDLYHAKSGRLSSKGSEDGGPQLQNIPPSARGIFIPDEGHIFVNADLKQAEGMVVSWLAEDEAMISAYERGIDTHRVRACILFKGWDKPSIPPTELLFAVTEVCPKCMQKGETKCPHSERYLAKRAGYAFAYKMGLRKFVSLLRKEDIFITEKEAKQIQNRVLTPPIRGWQRETESLLRTNHALVTPLGLKRTFFGVLDDDMLRAALSWVPQATVAQITNTAMVRLHPRLKEIGGRMVTQTHDSLLLSIPKEKVEEGTRLVEEAFVVPMTIKGRSLTIPTDVGTGESWGAVK